MKSPKLNFGNRTIPQQLAICRRVADGVAKLPAEQRAHVAGPDVAGRTDAAMAACAEVENLKVALRAALARRNQLVRAARQAATDTASGIAALTAGEPVAMLAVGIEVVRDKRPVGLPDAPTQLRTVPTDFEGTAQLRWQRPVRRCAFAVEATADPAAATGWQRQLTCLKQSCSIKGLADGTKYWFRVAASNAHGQGPWSQPVSVRVK